MTNQNDNLCSWEAVSTHTAIRIPLAHGPLTRFIKLRIAHAPRMPGTFYLLPGISDPGMHPGTCVTHVPWCMPGSLTSGFPWSTWQGKRSRHSRRILNPQFYVSGKKPMATSGMLETRHMQCDVDQTEDANQNTELLDNVLCSLTTLEWKQWTLF